MTQQEDRAIPAGKGGENPIPTDRLPKPQSRYPLPGPVRRRLPKPRDADADHSGPRVLPPLDWVEIIAVGIFGGLLLAEMAFLLCGG